MDCKSVPEGLSSMGWTGVSGTRCESLLLKLASFLETDVANVLPAFAKFIASRPERERNCYREAWEKIKACSEERMREGRISVDQEGKDSMDVEMLPPVPPRTSCYWTLTSQTYPHITKDCDSALQALYANLGISPKELQGSRNPFVLKDLAQSLRNKGYYCHEAIKEQLQSMCAGRVPSIQIPSPLFTKPGSR